MFKKKIKVESCYFLKSNEFSNFKFDEYELKICEPKDDNSGCEIKQCSDIPKGNCNAFNDYFSSSNRNKVYRARGRN